MIKKLVCKKCGHKWFPRSEKKPKYCPKCCNPNWNKASKKEIEDMLMTKFLK